MTLAEKVTVVVLAANLIALLAVTYQIYQNRQSILLTKHSIDADRKIRQAQLLPSVHFVIHVQVLLKMWLNDIAEILEALENSLTGKDVAGAKEISRRALSSPKGLVKTFLYQKGPPWLSQVCMAAAQHYYGFHSVLSALQSASVNETDCELVADVISEGKRSAMNIQSLLEYIDWIVPEAVAHAPASLNDNDFLSD